MIALLILFAVLLVACGGGAYLMAGWLLDVLGVAELLRWLLAVAWGCGAAAAIMRLIVRRNR